MTRQGFDDYDDPDEDCDIAPQHVCRDCMILLRIGETVCPVCGDDVTFDADEVQEATERRALDVNERT